MDEGLLSEDYEFDATVKRSKNSLDTIASNSPRPFSPNVNIGKVDEPGIPLITKARNHGERSRFRGG
jgi:hypothetical protein